MTSVRLLVLALGASIGVIFPFTAVILGSFGFTPGEVGASLSLASLASVLAVPTWGHLADVRLGRARALQACVLGASLAGLALLIRWPPIVVVVLVVTLYLFVSSYQPLTDALTINAIRGRAGYARVRLLSSLSFAVAVIVAGFLYDRTGYWLTFVLFAGASAVLAFAASRLTDVGRADLATYVAGVRRRFGSAGVALRVAPRLPLVLVAIAILHLGLIASYTFLGVRLVELGGQPSDVALASGLGAALEVPAMFVAGAVASRIGLRTMFAASAAFYAVAFGLWAVTDDPTIIIVSRMATGLSFTGMIVSIVLTIAALLPPDLQATGQALFQTTASGVSAIIANFVGGALYQGIGSDAVFWAAAGSATIAAILGFLAFPARSTRAPVRLPS